MQQIVAAYYFRFHIGEKRKSETHLLTMSFTDLRWIDADRDDLKTSSLKLGKSLLKTPQLGVAQWSPMTAIENQHRTVTTGKEIR